MRNQSSAFLKLLKTPRIGKLEYKKRKKPHKTRRKKSVTTQVGIGWTIIKLRN
jgi:hypothetical protein